MMLIELIEVMKAAPTRFHQTIDLWNKGRYICRMKTDSEIVQIYGGYKVSSVMGVDDEHLRVELSGK